MIFKNLVSTDSDKYESFEGEVDGKLFKIGRNLDRNNAFEEDLRGNLTKSQVSEIFSQIDNLRRQHKIL